MEIEFIEWIDSTQSSGWTELSEAMIEPSIAWSVGFIISETEVALLITGNYSPKSNQVGSIEQSCGQMAIPKCSIISRRKLTHSPGDPLPASADNKTDELKDLFTTVLDNSYLWKDPSCYSGFKNEDQQTFFMRGVKYGFFSALFWVADFYSRADLYELCFE